MRRAIMPLPLRVLVLIAVPLAAQSVKTSFDYFKASISSLGEKEVFGDAADDTDRAKALLSAVLLHEAKASYRVSGGKAQWLACSAKYVLGMETRGIFARLSASPQAVHSSRSDDCICFMVHLTTAAAEATKRDYLVTDGRATSGERVLGMLEPFPSVFKVPRRITDAAQGLLGAWALCDDHSLTVTFAPRGSTPRSAADVASWMQLRLETLGSSEYEEDFFWAVEHEGFSVDDHKKRFGTGSLARAWRGYRSTKSFRTEAAGGCGHADMLRIRLPGYASGGTADALNNPLLVDYGQRAEIFGHHHLGDRSIGVGNGWIPTVPASELQQRDACVRSLIVALVTSPEVTAVEVETRKKKASNMAAARLVQAGGTDSTLQPIWDAGLTGAGQVVQVGDTGVDQYHCLFHDADNGPVSTSTYDGTITTDMTKRKVVQYVVGSDGDQNDCPGGHGHGSHCAGSAIGGFASDYAVTVSDTCSSTSDSNGVLGCQVPDYYSNCGDYMDYCDATRFTIGDDNACDQTCYCSANRNGKYIGTGVSGGTTCKELIEESSGTGKGAKLAVADYTPASDCSTGSMYIGASDLYNYYWPAVYDSGAQARISSNSWGSAGCVEGEYDLFSYYTDLYTWENPDFAILYAAGNDGDDSSCVKSVGSPGTSKNGITVGATETGRWPELSTYYEEDENEKERTNDPDDLAYFSSIGPTADGRYKPDVVAPGYFVVSANSSGYSNTASCSVAYMQGTSMATPIAAGAAALIREYFTSGFYSAHVSYIAGLVVSGSTCLSSYVCHDKTWISGNLVKAILINSAEPLWGRYIYDNDDIATLRPPPTKEQGFGRVALETSMPVTQSSPYTGGTALFVDDNRTGIVAYETKSYTWTNLQISGAQRNLWVTLAWNDPPNEGYATATKQLVHDLDLTVTCVATGFVWYGNGGASADELNNVERVNISHPMSCATMTVGVTAHALTYATHQPYALVIAGAGIVGEEGLENPPSKVPTLAPSPLPTLEPTAMPSFAPTLDPTSEPTLLPSFHPTLAPTLAPTASPSLLPTSEPTASPSLEPTPMPSKTFTPTGLPTLAPTSQPSFAPLSAPTLEPTLQPSPAPTLVPTSQPSFAPLPAPTLQPTLQPSFAPTLVPTPLPSPLPTDLLMVGTMSATSYECDTDTVALDWTIEAGVNPSDSCGLLTVELMKSSSLAVLDSLALDQVPSAGSNAFFWSPQSSAGYCPNEGLRLKLTCNSPSRVDQAPWYSSSFDLTWTPNPTPAPLLPTSSPTSLPTASDTVAVSVVISMTSTTPATDSEKATLKTTIASVLSLDESNIHNFVVTSTADTSRRHRRRLSARSRSLATTYTHTVAFDVVVALSQLSDDSISSAADLSASVSTSLDENLEAAVSDAGIDATVEAVSTSTLSDDDDNDNGDSSGKGGGSDGNVIGIAVGCTIGGLALLGGGAFAMHMQKQKKRKEQTGHQSAVSEVELRPQEFDAAGNHLHPSKAEAGEEVGRASAGVAKTKTRVAVRAVF